MANSKKIRVLTFCMALTMVASMLTACGNSGNTNSNASNTQSTESTGDTGNIGKEEGEYTKLIWLSSGSAINEEDKSLVTAEAAKKTGIFVQHNYVPAEKWNVLMASGDMEADILEVPAVSRQQLIEGGLIVPLEELIEKNAPNIKKTISPKAMSYWTEYVSYGKNKLYLLSSHQAPDMSVVYNAVPYNYGVAPYIRWDYYEELGSPKVTNEDDLLKLLKQMQEAHPTNELNRKTYPMSLDTTAGLWSYHTMYSYYNGKEGVAGYMMARDSKDNLSNILQDDFISWNAARYYNKAWQLGILDPESFTQKGENVAEKITNSQSFYTENSWNNYNTVLGEKIGPNAGFEPILEAFPAAYAGGTSQFGWGFATAITATTKHADEAMKFLDFLYSEEGARLFYSGIEGTHWEKVDGVPAYTKEVMENRGQAAWDKANGLNNFGNWIGIDNMIPSSDGYPVDIGQTPEMLKKNNKPIDEHYCSIYGVDYPGQVGKKMEKERPGYEVIWWNGDTGSLMQTMPDEISRYLVQCTDILLKAFPKMIMSNSDAEFEKEKANAKKQLEEANVQKIIDWSTNEWNTAAEKVKALD